MKLPWIYVGLHRQLNLLTKHFYSWLYRLLLVTHYKNNKRYFSR